jgi:citrate synthase
MAQTVHVKNMGLRGVTVADTKISFIDGDNGILLYRGYRIEQLAEAATFMEVAYLILYGVLPDRTALEKFEAMVRDARSLPDYVIKNLKNLPHDAAPMDVLQSSIAALSMSDPDVKEESRTANLNMAVRLLARMPVLVAAWHRISQGLEPLPPDDSLSHAANFLWQFHGEKPDGEMARDLDTCLVLHADHTFNASTFACREVVSTRAHMYAGVCAGIGALSGSLHGGANARVMKMLLELEFEKDIPGWVKKELDGGGRSWAWAMRCIKPWTRERNSSKLWLSGWVKKPAESGGTSFQPRLKNTVSRLFEIAARPIFYPMWISTVRRFIISWAFPSIL